MGDWKGLVPSFSKAEQAGEPCTTGSGGRMVACVALDGDMLLGKTCPCASGQSPALTRFWVAEPGSGLVYTTCSPH